MGLHGCPPGLWALKKLRVLRAVSGPGYESSSLYVNHQNSLIYLWWLYVNYAHNVTWIAADKLSLAECFRLFAMTRWHHLITRLKEPTYNSWNSLELIFSTTHSRREFISADWLQIEFPALINLSNTATLIHNTSGPDMASAPTSQLGPWIRLYM